MNRFSAESPESPIPLAFWNEGLRGRGQGDWSANRAVALIGVLELKSMLNPLSSG